MTDIPSRLALFRIDRLARHIEAAPAPGNVAILARAIEAEFRALVRDMSITMPTLNALTALPKGH